MPVAESQQARPYLMERMGSDEQVVTMTSHGRNRNTGRVPVMQYAEPVPRGHSPSKLAASSGKTLSVVRVEGDSGGALTDLQTCKTRQKIGDHSYTVRFCLYQTQ